ncbi:MAG: TonB-dependent receptor [Bacteroidales bacterium]|nr:TonB-dependent receptor [Bacteroidales bacterium]
MKKLYLSAILIQFIIVNVFSQLSFFPDTLSKEICINDTIKTEAINKLPFRDINKFSLLSSGVYELMPGIYMSNGNFLSEYCYIDGIKIRNVNNFPVSAISTYKLNNSNLSVRYGNTYGDAIIINTNNNSNKAWIKSDINTSLLNNGYKNIEAEIETNIPINKFIFKGITNSPILYLSGRFHKTNDYSLSYIDIPQVNDETFSQLREMPLALYPDISLTYPIAEELTNDNINFYSYKKNAGGNSINVYGKLIIPVGNKINITFGNYTQMGTKKMFIFENVLLNFHNNPEVIIRNIDNYVKLSHKIFTNSNSELSYNLSLAHSTYYKKQQSPVHKDNFFNYGYIGRFITTKIKSYEYNIDTVSGMTGWIHNGYADIQYMLDNTFPYGKPNPMVSKYTEKYYELFSDNPLMYMNSVMVINGGGLLNGDNPSSVYNLWNNIGHQNDLYGIDDNQFINGDFEVNYKIKNHNIKFGYQYEKEIYRYYRINPVELWTLARGLTNSHILELDLANPYLVYNNGDFLYSVDNPDGIFLDSVYYKRLYQENIQTLFDINLRKHFGLPLDGTEWIDFDSYAPGDLSIEYFSADDLLNRGNSFVYYAGYNAYGEKNSNSSSFSDFFNIVDNENGFKTRAVDAFQPVCQSAYMQYEFNHKFFDFTAGLRIERYDAKQKVLKDEYIFFDSYTAGDNDPNGIIQNTNIPDVIGDDYVVYVNSLTDPTKINGYRNGRTWYDASGNVIYDPSLIYASGLIAPYLKSPGENPGDASFLSAFEDYKPENKLLPHIKLEIKPISILKVFGSYNSYTKNPSRFYSQLIPMDYLFIRQNAGKIINNPNLKPERTNKWNAGFRLFDNRCFFQAQYSNITQKDLMFLETFWGAYPVSYYSFDNNGEKTLQTINLNAGFFYFLNILSLQTNYTFYFFEDFYNYQALPKYMFNNNLIIDFTNFKTSNNKLNKTFNGFSIGIFEHFRKGFNYTKTDIITGYIQGFMFGEQMPSIHYFDLKINKNIEFSCIKARLNLYLIVQNVFNKMNVYNVYSNTGKPDDDGYLVNPQNQLYINSKNNPQAFRDLYSLKLNNPYFYGMPRIFKAGIVLNY